jgi:hypothetical protein
MKFSLIILLFLTFNFSSHAATVKDLDPKVWVFCGLMGAETYQLNAAAVVNSLEQSLTKRFQVKQEDLTILSAYCKGKKSCCRTNFTAELKRVNQTIQSGREVMLFFYGHADKNHGDVLFNIEGKDLNIQDIAAQIDAPATSPVITWVSTEFSGDFIKPFAGFNRITITADVEREEGLDPDFMMSLAKAFESKAFEKETVKTVSIFDLLVESRTQLKLFCDTMNVTALEASAGDGAGDCIARRTPVKDDAYPIETIGFTITKGQLKEEATGGGNHLRLVQN